MINVSGVKVDPREVQAVLESLPGIEQALVHGIEDAAGLTVIRALLISEGEISTEEVLRYCRGRLAEYKLPRVVEFVNSIPQDLMGKTARRLMEN
jgi:long-chain acyl-CoA synthetase